MLKNKVKNVLKHKFDFNPYRTNNIVKEHSIIENYDTEIDPVAIATESIYIDIPNYLVSPSFKKTRPLILCVFKIITNEMYPCLLYLLFKTTENVLNFISMNDILRNKHTAVDYISKLLSTTDISYAGFCETNKNNIIFLKYCSRVNVVDIPSNYYWATPHELVNLKTVINLPINGFVTRFFMDNSSLLILRNEDECQYISPVIGYYTTNKLDTHKLDAEKNDYSYVDIFSEKINKGDNHDCATQNWKNNFWPGHFATLDVRCAGTGSGQRFFAPELVFGWATCAFLFWGGQRFLQTRGH